MKRHLWGLALAGVVFAVAACAKDPTASINGTPARIVPTFSKMFLFPGDSLLVLAEVRDSQGVPLPIIAEASSADPAVVGVSDAYIPPLQQARFYVRAEAVGGAKVILSAANLTDTILVSVFPAVFQGDVSIATGGLLDTVTVSVGTSGLVFIPGETNVLIDGEATRIVSSTADQIQVIPLTIDALTDVTLTVENMTFLEGTQYESTIESLDAENNIDVSGEDNEPGNNDPATATPITVGGAALEGLSAEGDPDDFFTFTLAAPATVDISVQFDGLGGDPDIDAYLLNAAADNFCVLDGCAMGTGSQPEEYTATLAAGTYTIYINWFGDGAATPPHWYRLKIE